MSKSSLKELLKEDPCAEVIRQERKNGVLITIDDLQGYGSLIAEVLGVGIQDIILLQKRHVSMINNLLDSFGEGKQSKRSFTKVIKLYFGIGTYKRTMKEIADEFNVTPPAIRVDIHRVLRSLKRNYAQELKALTFTKRD